MDVAIAGMKRPDLARSVRRRLERLGRRLDLLDTFLPRREFLERARAEARAHDIAAERAGVLAVFAAAVAEGVPATVSTTAASPVVTADVSAE